LDPSSKDERPRIALLYPGDRDARRRSSREESRFMPVFHEIERLGARPEPAIYHDDFAEDVRAQLLNVHAVLVWVNPIEGERDRSVLDAMLRDVAARGVFVSTHPDVILKLGTKQVLYDTRDIGWGCDTHVYRSVAEMGAQLPDRLAEGARVLKQYRGNGGNGIWRVELAPGSSTLVRARHAKRGSIEETLSLEAFCARCEPYFAASGRMIDQAWQPRLPEGMIRCYLVHDRVEGFGHQAINALYPAPEGSRPEDAAQPGPRLYHPATKPEFQALKRKLENEWVPAMQQRLDIAKHSLPVLWDCDFLLGAKDAEGHDTYVLCEINVSCVSPFPDSALIPVAQAAFERARAARNTQSISTT
jgi:hypothetical protein